MNNSTTNTLSNNWPDEIRLKAIGRSEFYNNPSVYLYGYYDGYQEALNKVETLELALLELRDSIPSQTNDKDWWPDGLAAAMAKANELV